MLTVASSESAISRTQVPLSFKERREDVNYNASPSCPSTSTYMHDWSLKPFS